MTDSSKDYKGEGIAPVHSDVVDEGVLGRDEEDEEEMQDADVLPASEEFDDPNDPLAVRRENIVEGERSNRAKDFKDVFAKENELDKAVEDVVQANSASSSLYGTLASEV
ncbi:putative ATP-dependent RNA helicase [Rhodotorula toruloides ATCC 204091]|uniref:BY PROTMAP: gi/342321023/gb/EGU12961.1/ putative ATP-dependent RNA helicase [Rhodotorula glutinis ATCC 204091] n=1 Tax=Rhodotorula toruloides TaxID=5286 RepID=A0A0K3CEW3_RHOTO|nr:putative ATP-dependent RNA helicase [Rhodotorula toruloides ATCC 204091]